ncbi:MBOAT-domain-containing protein [Obelidium mucronatum]|nr:MBOAT-domain-containing protein [Obelidium mucronatum]
MGSFVIHCIAMLMKQASYLMSNVDNFWRLQEIPLLQAEIAHLKADQQEHHRNDAPSFKLEEESNKELTAIQLELDQFESDLKGKVTGLPFPQNLTFVNFVDYMAIPSLVYEIEYPRTDRFRPIYFLWKVAGTFGTFFLIVSIVEHQITPVLEISHEITFVTSIMRLLLPFMICFLLVFFIIFEFICNAFAELTFFADREFYEDWWNSTTFDEYARRWNKPVHEFLLRHVYLESMTTHNMSRHKSSLLTFFISSVFHELVMMMTGKRLRPWLFLLQMFQIPLIYMAGMPFIKRNRTLGNALFWFGMFLGPPLLGALYSRDHYMNP